MIWLRSPENAWTAHWPACIGAERRLCQFDAGISNTKTVNTPANHIRKKTQHEWSQFERVPLDESGHYTCTVFTIFMNITKLRKNDNNYNTLIYQTLHDGSVRVICCNNYIKMENPGCNILKKLIPVTTSVIYIGKKYKFLAPYYHIYGKHLWHHICYID